MPRGQLNGGGLLVSATVGMIGPVGTTLVALRGGLLRGAQGHAAFGTIARMILHDLRMHRTSVGLRRVAGRARALKPRGQVKVEPGRCADEDRQEQDAEQ